MEVGELSKEVMKRRPPGRRKQGRPKLTWAEGIRGLMGERGLVERQTQLQEEDNIMSKWAQEDVNTLYSLQRNNSNK
jgi:hypothetical protein